MLKKLLNNEKTFMRTNVLIMLLFVPLNATLSICKPTEYHNWFSVILWLVYTGWHLLRRDFQINPEKYKLEKSEDFNDESIENTI